MKLKWSIDQLYFYLVCFVMLIVIIIGITNMVQAGIELLIPIPETDYSRPYPPIYEKIPEREGAESQLPRDVIDRELSEQENFIKEREKRNSSNSAMLQFFRGLAKLLVAFPVYIFHWRKIPQLTS